MVLPTLCRHCQSKNPSANIVGCFPVPAADMDLVFVDLALLLDVMYVTKGPIV